MMNKEAKTIVTDNGLVIDEWADIVYNIPRIGDSLKFPTTDGHVIKKVMDVIWGMKEYNTLEICV